MKKLFGAIVLVLASMSANATLIGTNAGCDIEPSFFWSCDTSSNTVMDGVAEFFLQLNGNDFFAVDLTADSLQIENINGGSLGAGAGEFLTLTLQAGLFDEVSFNVISQVTGLDDSDLGFDGEVFTLDFNNTSWGVGSFVLLNFVNSNGPNPIPNVPALLLVMTGLLAMRRRNV
ncbi:MAG: hypothetical protein Alis3KO_18560 [Aliiglaciecola sp.]